MNDDQKETLRTMQSMIEQINTRLFISALEGKISGDSKARMKSRLVWLLSRVDNL